MGTSTRRAALPSTRWWSNWCWRRAAICGRRRAGCSRRPGCRKIWRCSTCCSKRASRSANAPAWRRWRSRASGNWRRCSRSTSTSTRWRCCGAWRWCPARTRRRRRRSPRGPRPIGASAGSSRPRYCVITTLRCARRRSAGEPSCSAICRNGSTGCAVGNVGSSTCSQTAASSNCRAARRRWARWRAAITGCCRCRRRGWRRSCKRRPTIWVKACSVIYRRSA